MIVPLTVPQKEELALKVRNYRNLEVCNGHHDTYTVADYMCETGRDRESCPATSYSADCFFQHKYETTLEKGGYSESRFDMLRYAVLNFGVAAAAFVAIFSLAYLIPMLARGVALFTQRYWKWLKA